MKLNVWLSIGKAPEIQVGKKKPEKKGQNYVHWRHLGICARSMFVRQTLTALIFYMESI